MTNNELLAKILGEKKCHISCSELPQVACKHDCNKCEYNHFGEQEADLAKVYANISEMGLGKALLNRLYGKSVNYKDTDTFPMNPPVDPWIEVPTEILNEDCQHIMEIIDDATVHGLNFKYENGRWYFSEGQSVPN